ncbi:unnamed protein product [Cylicocyclus nassatus]|uniref:Uncharacterized protein n=1 Tax=Cylicocyclus nassatus TaxID=53992 RepID=A0AA36H066_CYLNA|nr:unnamed protein product [Cylicocyclus nassatus]
MFDPLLCYDNSDPYRLAVELNLDVAYKMNFSLHCKKSALSFLNIFIRHKKELTAEKPPAELDENSELAEYLSDPRYKLRFPSGEGFLESWYEESKWLPDDRAVENEEVIQTYREDASSLLRL